ncbi:MAG: hypothetical protein NkDv07_0160 [Candidatus Improbicoccus devescovinae]|nr:MAG: hypothetical protein NkDv07_0160 [Candidatus Improbicoccus devescovinae]
MSENLNPFRSPEGMFLNNNFREAVCIDAYRVYDSCADKDCIENTRCYFIESVQHLIEDARNVKLKCVSVINTALDIEPLPFQKGFYSIDLTFFFEVILDVYTTIGGAASTVSGFCSFNKKVILYGSEGSVKVYSSDFSCNSPDVQNLPGKNLPRATCQVANPIGLSAKICEVTEHYCDGLNYKIPESICRRFGGNFVCGNITKSVSVTLGLFTIVQIERNVQMLVPSLDFCLPEKECRASSDNPCELFSKIEFPTSEFFPPKNLDASLLNSCTSKDSCEKKCCEDHCEPKCKCKCKNKCNCGCCPKTEFVKCGC